jgi:hypothetical protein
MEISLRSDLNSQSPGGVCNTPGDLEMDIKRYMETENTGKRVNENEGI